MAMKLYKTSRQNCIQHCRDAIKIISEGSEIYLPSS